MREFQMSSFCRVFLLRYSDRLASAEKDFLLAKEAELCQVSAAAKEAAASRRAPAFVEVQAFFAQNADTRWKQAKNFFDRHVALLNADQKEHLEDWEFVLCDKSKLEAAPFLAGLQRSFARLSALVQAYSAVLRAQEKSSLVKALQSLTRELM